MKKLCIMLGLLAVALGQAVPARAEHALHIRNNTGMTFTQFYIAGTEEKEWSPDLFAGDNFKLEDGQIDDMTLPITLKGENCSVDVRAEDTNGKWYEFYGIDICKYPSFSLNVDENGKVTWHSY